MTGHIVCKFHGILILFILSLDKVQIQIKNLVSEYNAEKHFDDERPKNPPNKMSPGD